MVKFVWLRTLVLRKKQKQMKKVSQQNNCLTPWAVVLDAPFTLAILDLKWLRKIQWERQEDKSVKDVCIHSILKRTFITKQAGPVNVFSLHGPIYPPLVSKRSALSPVRNRHSRGKSSYLSDSLSLRLNPGCEAGEARQKGRNRVCHQQLKRIAWQQDWWHLRWK